MNVNLWLTNRIYRFCEKRKLLDTQIVLNWLDKLNEISVSH